MSLMPIVAPRTGYRTSAVSFDGTNDYMSRGADLTGNADGKKGIISFWFLMDGGDGISMDFISNKPAAPQFLVFRSAANTVRVVGKNTVTGNILILVSNTTYTSSSTWHHFLASWDLTLLTGAMYIDNVNVLAAAPTLLNQDIDYTQTNWAIGANANDGSDKINASLADFYFNNSQYLDISDAANRVKFISGGKPVNLGSDGSLPTGTAPIVFVKGPATSFNTNLGTGGNFTVTGTLTDAPTSPSD